MGFISFLKLLTYFSNVLSWPSFSFLYPLFASIRAIETDEEYHYQKCLKYWVVFSIATIFECTFAKILVWLSLWPFVKGITAVMLAVPSFAGASYVYTHYISPHIAMESSLHETSPIPNAKGCLEISNGILCKALLHNRDDEELEKLITYEDATDTICTIRNVLSSPRNIKQGQRETHLKGKKHRTKEEELKRKRLVESKEASIPLTWDIYEKLTNFINPGTNPSRWSVWVKPEFGWIKLNTDGSIDRDNSSFGGVLRDYLANPICAYHSRAPGDDIFLAELWAIWRGLVLCLGLGIEAIWVESDSMSVVKTINKQQPYPIKASSCLEHIWVLLNKFEKQIVSHAWRESNKAADYLSRLDILGSDIVLWPGDFPTELCKIIQEDASGRKYYRR
ncbi:hypothetical protein ACJIZ3_003163 [Penstemon smallii]|uniref:RNase H type-1 domain-containing protein n=1 Tax=Penstemon smallii TaxID=265156 RepID=A0ABD3U9W3_9LAMI